MPKVKDSSRQDELREIIKEVQNKPSNVRGFLESYKEFLDRWGSYQKTSKPTKGKPVGRPRRAMFKVIPTQYK